MRPLLSIIVPTKGRYAYLKNLVDLVSKFESQDFEMVIQDNSDDNDPFLPFLRTLNDDRIKYFYNPSHLTSIQNFDNAVLNATGKYISFIGDDDFCLRNICDVVRYMGKNQIDAARFDRATYFWPDAPKHKAILITGFFSDKVEYLNPLDALREVLATGCQCLDILPSLYYGIIRRDTLDRVYDIGKTYFPGNSADIANGVAVSFFIRKYAFFHLPIIVPGTSIKTGGGTYGEKNRTYLLNAVPFISRSAIEKWDSSLPRIWHGSIVWPESALSSLKYVGQMDFKKYMNYSKIWLTYAQVNNDFFEDAKIRFRSRCLFYMAYMMNEISKYAKYALNLIIRSFTSNYRLGGYRFKNMNSPAEAEDFIYERIRKFCAFISN